MLKAGHPVVTPPTPDPQGGQSQGMGTGRWRKSGPPRNAPALLPAWQNQAQGPPSVLGMLEATALETRGPEARPHCSQGSSGHCKGYPQYPHPLSRTVGPRVPRWGFLNPSLLRLPFSLSPSLISPPHSPSSQSSGSGVSRTADPHPGLCCVPQPPRGWPCRSPCRPVS